jgi:hypothetical protein
MRNKLNLHKVEMNSVLVLESIDLLLHKFLVGLFIGKTLSFNSLGLKSPSLILLLLLLLHHTRGLRSLVGNCG